MEEREIFRDPLSREEIQGLLKLQSMEHLFSRKSTRLKALNLSVDELSDTEKLEWMTKEPALLRRPIVVVDDQLVVGFDTGKLEQLFS